MRNIIEYPATINEIVECLQNVSENFSNGSEIVCGDMRPYLLSLAAKILTDLGKMVEHAPVLKPEKPNSTDYYEIEDFGAASIDYEYASMVRRNQILLDKKRIQLYKRFISLGEVMWI